MGGTRTDRVAVALSQAAAAAAALGNLNRHSAMVSRQSLGIPRLQRPPGFDYCLHASPVFSAAHGRNEGQMGRRLWHRDSSNSPSPEGGVQRRGRKRRDWWEPLQDAKKLRQQQDQAPDFASMSSTEMNDYVRWWRKMHALTWRSDNVGALSSQGDVPPPGTPQGTSPMDWFQQNTGRRSS